MIPMNRIQSHAAQIAGTAVSTTGSATAIAAWQSHLAWGVTIAAGVVAIVSGLLTIRSLLRREKK